MNPVLLETKKLLLKGFSPEDMKSIFENFSKPQIKNIFGHRSEEAYLKEEDKFQKGYSSYNRSFILFLIIDKKSDIIIGRCGLHNWNMEHRRAEIGYVMEDEEYKRKGIMTEALGAIIDYGFSQVKLHRIEALVGSNNVPSLLLMKKYYFVKEGVMRQHYYMDGKFEDSIVFSLLNMEHNSDKK